MIFLNPAPCTTGTMLWVIVVQVACNEMQQNSMTVIASTANYDTPLTWPDEFSMTVSNGGRDIFGQGSSKRGPGMKKKV